MAETKQTETETKNAAADSPVVGRNTGIPPFSLKKAMGHAEKLYKVHGQMTLPRPVAMKALGYSEKSGAGLVTLGGLKKFGLIKYDGTGSLALSNRALDLVGPPPPDGSRAAALQDAATAPSIYRELLDKWNGKLPNDALIAFHLERELKFNRDSIAPFIYDLRETMGLAESAKGGIVPPKVETTDGPEEEIDMFKDVLPAAQPQKEREAESTAKRTRTTPLSMPIDFDSNGDVISAHIVFEAPADMTKRDLLQKLIDKLKEFLPSNTPQKK